MRSTLLASASLHFRPAALMAACALVAGGALASDQRARDESDALVVASGDTRLLVTGSARALVADDSASAEQPSFVVLPGQEVEEFAGPVSSAAIPGCGSTTSYTIVTGGACLGAPNCTTMGVTGGTRSNRNGVTSACPGKACPGSLTVGTTVTNQYNIYHFTASDCQCITVSQTQAAGQTVCSSMGGATNVAFAGLVTSMAGGFPSNCLPPGATRYLGDTGVGLISGTLSYSFCLAPGETEFSIVVASSTATPAAPGCSGSISVACSTCNQNFDCVMRPINNALQALEAKLDGMGGGMNCEIIRLLNTPDGLRSACSQQVIDTCGTGYSWNSQSTGGPRPDCE